MKQVYAAPENVGNVLVTSGDWMPMSASNNESDIIELIKLTHFLRDAKVKLLFIAIGR